MKIHSTSEVKHDPRTIIYSQPTHVVGSSKCAWGLYLSVKSSLPLLNNYTGSTRSRTCSWFICHNLFCAHLVFQAGDELYVTECSLTTRKSWRSIAFFSLLGNITTFTMSFSSPYKGIDVCISSQQKTSAMLRSWYKHSIQQFWEAAIIEELDPFQVRIFLSFSVWLDGVLYKFPTYRLYHRQITLNWGAVYPWPVATGRQ